MGIFDSTEEEFSDLLPYSHLADNGIQALKHGAYLSAWAYRGPDMETASYGEMARLSSRVNSILVRLGAGWTVVSDIIRTSVTGYTDQSPDHPVLRLIDNERRRMFNRMGQTYESTYVLAVIYTPPLTLQKRMENWFYDRPNRVKLDPRAQREALAELTLQKFRSVCQQIEASMEKLNMVHRLGEYVGDDGVAYCELLQYLRFCVQGVNAPVRRSCVPAHVDQLLSASFLGGMAPKVDGKHLRVVAIDGYPVESWPAILESLDRLPFEYRWNNRIILLDQHEAKQRFNRIRAKWAQQKRSLRDVMSKNAAGGINADAKAMDEDANEASGLASEGRVLFTCYTAVVVIMDRDEQIADDRAALVKNTLDGLGFPARIEDANAVEAYLGSIPGNTRANVRQPMPHTLNVADFVPFSSSWGGSPTNPCPPPKYPPNSPPLLQAVASGETVFKCSLHVHDVGMFGVIGSTGNGKSTLVGTICASHMRYPNARVIAVDLKRSLMPLGLLPGHQHYDLGVDGARRLCPLGHIDSDSDRAWAVDYIAMLMELQGVTVTPRMRNEVARTIRAMSEGRHRSLTNFSTLVQDLDVRAAMAHYCGSGPLASILDGDALEDGELEIGDFTVFETVALQNRGEGTSQAVLTYLFHAIERTFDGRPTLFIVEEFGIQMNSPYWRKKVDEWLRRLRDANVAFGFATQDVGSLADNELSHIVINSLASLFLLPNDKLDGPMIRDTYARYLGLTPRQMEKLQGAKAQRDYLYMSTLGRRMIDLRLGPAALAFVGATGVNNITRIKELVAEHGDDWPAAWLRERGESELADELEQLESEHAQKNPACRSPRRAAA